MPGGNRGAGRRGRQGAPQPVGLEEVAADLARGRVAAGLSLADVADRTGVPADQVEALEAGRLDPFPTERSAVGAARRLAELVGTDAPTAMAATADRWRSTMPVGPTTAVVPPAVTGHLSRYPGDSSHLTPFTRTGEVPAVGRPAAPPPPVSPRVTGVVHTGPATGAYPAVAPVPARARRAPAPLTLRLALALAILLVVLAGAGLVVQHVRPRWLDALHPTTGRTPTTASATTGGGTPAPAGTITTTPGGTATTAVTVRAGHYQVVVAGLADAWVQVTVPTSLSPLFAGIISPGQTETFTPSAGRLSVEFGGAQVLVSVKVADKTVPGWLFKPSVVPYTLTFSAAG